MFHLPTKKSDVSESVFYYSGENSWKVWRKPPGANFIYTLLIGGGGGGGGGAGVGSGANASGGGGGASSSITKAIIPAFIIPDQLYVLVGAGGNGGNGGTYNSVIPQNNPGSTGSTGGFSFLSIQPNSTSTLNVLLSSGDYSGSGARGGTGGDYLAVSTGGTSGAIFNSTLGLLSDCFVYDCTLGKNGVGGPLSGLSNVDPLLTPCSIVLPGAPGGNISSSNVPNVGSGILSHSFLNATTGGATGADGAPGQSFLMNINQPMFFTSGTGGGAANSIAGKGGNGSYGCGGGGGGAAAFGGAGGKGGDGLVIIVAW